MHLDLYKLSAYIPHTHCFGSLAGIIVFVFSCGGLDNGIHWTCWCWPHMGHMDMSAQN